MKKVLLCAAMSMMTTMALNAQNPAAIKLDAPNKNRGESIMKALNDRKSTAEYSDKPVNRADMSDLFWAANGINREDGRRTAASAMNRQDVDSYAFTAEGVYKYDAKTHTLTGVAAGDRRLLFGERGMSPLIVLLVSDVSKFGDAGSAELRREWGAIDAGLVAQNIALFCAGNGMGAKPRASMDREGIKKLLNLNELQLPMLNVTVGYPK